MVQVITLLSGDNDYELTKKVAQLKAGFDGESERYDAVDLTKEQLADIFTGQTLFAMKRFVVIDSPSACSDLWQDMPAWAERLSTDTDVVLVEPKPDKRTSTYKWLKKNVTVLEFMSLDERDTRGILKWLEAYAHDNDVRLTSQQLRRLVDRAGASQWELAHAIDKLALVDTITDQWIDTVAQPSPSENVFALFETTLTGDTSHLQVMLATLRLTEDPYRIFGLINTQALQLVALVYGDGNAAKVASDTNASSPYPFQKLSSYAARLTKVQARRMIDMLAQSDIRLKSSDADPWMVLESTLVRMASLLNE